MIAKKIEKEIISKYSIDNKSITTISKELKISYNSIMKVLKDLKIYKKINLDEIISPAFLQKEYIDNEKSISQISKESGFNFRTIANRIKKYKIKINRGNKKYKDYTGQKFGMLTVIKTIKNSQNIRLWVCQCKCGNIKNVIPGHLIANIKSCGCKHTFGMYNHIPYWYFKGFKIKSSHYKDARKEFDLTIEHLDELWCKQNGKCAISGVDICLGKTQSQRGITTGSIDRIDSSKGHIQGNVQWVHKDVNLIKNRFNEQYFIEICKKIVLNKYSKEELLKDIDDLATS